MKALNTSKKSPSRGNAKRLFLRAFRKVAAIALASGCLTLSSGCDNLESAEDASNKQNEICEQMRRNLKEHEDYCDRKSCSKEFWDEIQIRRDSLRDACGKVQSP